MEGVSTGLGSDADVMGQPAAYPSQSDNEYQETNLLSRNMSVNIRQIVQILSILAFSESSELGARQTHHVPSPTTWCHAQSVSKVSGQR